MPEYVVRGKLQIRNYTHIRYFSIVILNRNLKMLVFRSYFDVFFIGGMYIRSNAKRFVAHRVAEIQGLKCYRLEI